MNIVKSYLGHLSGYVVAGAVIVSSINPGLIPPQYSFFTALAGAIVMASHHGYTAGSANAVVTAAATAATKALTVATDAVPKLTPVLLACVLGLATLSGCTTLTPAQKVQVNSGITVAVDIATGFAIQQKSNDPAAWKARAIEFKAIALELQAVNSAGTATLATLAADLQPMIAKLPPADQLGANALVAALVPFLNGQIQANPSAGAVQAEVGAVLATFIGACEAYGG